MEDNIQDKLTYDKLYSLEVADIEGEENSYISEDYYDSASEDNITIIEPGQSELLSHFPGIGLMPLPWENRRNLVNMPETNPEFARFRDLFVSHHLRHPEYIRINQTLHVLRLKLFSDRESVPD